MTVSDTLGAVGELAVLARIFPLLPSAAHELLGPGDDAAVVAAPDGRYVVTTDMMIHGPDFRLAWSTAHDLGWKAAASNLSDVAAMGAVPTALVVALAAPADSPVSLLEGIAEGLRDACAALAPGCGVVGGDLSVSSTLTIAVTAFGDLEGRPAVLRSGAREGDIIAVSGVLGAAAAALRILFEEAVDSDGQPDADRAALLRDRTVAQLAPTPPITDGRLAALGGATAMLDLSDGLAIDSARLAKASQIALNFDSRALGAHPQLALGGGEDHSLLATFPPGMPLPGNFRRIGSVIVGSGIFLDGSPVSKAGWDPYRDWNGGRG
ncbi:MAG: thiL [Homoserinimonas sp.]|nr:thiL [Homoserinimonas sp.]